VAGLVALLLGDSCDTTGGETGCSRADELGEAADELELGVRGGYAKLVAEKVFGVEEGFEGVPVMMSTR